MASIYQRTRGSHAGQWVVSVSLEDGKRREFVSMNREEAERKFRAAYDQPVVASVVDAEPAPDESELRRADRYRAEGRRSLMDAKRIHEAIASAEAYQETIAQYAPLLSVPVLERFHSPQSAPHHTWVLTISDWHVGQKTESVHTGGLFEQTLEQTRGQVRELAAVLERLRAIAAKSITVDELVILDVGDMHENSGMRPRQAVEIDGTVTEQCIEVVDLQAWFIQQALSIFPRVRVHKVGGNHDRISQKAGLGGLGELAYHDTYQWLAGEFLRRMFTNATDAGRFTLTNHKTFFGMDIIAGQRFVFEHGASFRTSSGSYGGIGWYPIQNAGNRYRNMLDGADFVVMGHFHTAACLPMGRGWQVLNGALPPSTPFVQASFKSVSTPNQVLLDLNAKHGLVGFRPIYLPHEGIAAPGAAWRRLEQAA